MQETATAQPKMLSEQATEFALKNGLDIVSDLFGNMFVVQREGQEAYRVARLDPKAKGGAVLGNTDYATVDKAMAHIRHAKGTTGPTEPIASVPDQVVMERYARAHGVKASDHSHSHYMTISKPVADRRRDWQVAKRVGLTLKPLSEIRVQDRWAASNKVQQLGGPEITETLSGPHKFPYGDSYAKAPVKGGGRDGSQGDKAA